MKDREYTIHCPRCWTIISDQTIKVSFDVPEEEIKKVLKGSHGGSAEPHIDIPRYIRLVQAGKLKLDGLITREFRLDKINEGVEAVRGGEPGRVLVVMG